MEMLCLKHFGEILRKQLGDGGMFTDASVLTLISALVINRLEGLACNLILLYTLLQGRGVLPYKWATQVCDAPKGTVLV